MGSRPRLGIVWPKDPRPGNPSRWRRRWRLLDILLNKGPDMFIGKIDTCCSSLSRASWSGWHSDCNCSSSTVQPPDPFPWARRSSGEKYDFRTRRYRVPDESSWSDVQYCNGRRRKRPGRRDWETHVIPERVWDMHGREHPTYYWHDAVYGGLHGAGGSACATAGQSSGWCCC